MVTSLLSAILRCWDWEPPAGWKKHLLFAGPAALLCAAFIYVGAVRTHTCGHDIFILLDGAWRILNGQRPHVDYFSALGPVTYLVPAAGLALSGLRVEGIGYGAALAAASMGLWGYRLCLSRMRFTPAALTGLFLVLLTGTPVPLGAGPFSLSHAMAYNRLGFALLSVVLIEVMESPWGAWNKVRAELFGGLSTGAACVLLLFLKASYFLVAAVLVLGFAALRPRSRRNWLGLSVGACLVLALMWSYLEWNLSAFWADQRMAATARGQSLSVVEILRLAWRNQGNLLCMMLLGALVTTWNGVASRLAQWKWVLAALAVFSAGILLMSTNAQDEGLPLSVILVMLMLGGPWPGREKWPQGRACCLLCGALLLGFAGALDKVSLLEAVRERWQTPPDGAEFLPAHLSGLRLYDLADAQHPLAHSNGRKYADSVNEGLRLLQTHSASHESVMTLEQLNPFSYALLRKPAHGGFLFLGYQHSFSESRQPSGEWLFGETDIVMVPKRNLTDAGQYAAILRAYLRYVQSAFSLAAESPTWRMYRRKK